MLDIHRWAQRLLAGAPDHRDVALGALNGAVGDRLADSGSSLATQLRLFTSEPRRANACVFVHGLMGTEQDWSLWAKTQYPDELEAARDVTPIRVRYNSGRHISTNGRALAEALEELTTQWPGLESLSFVAHSMGGLVTRSALHYGLEAEHAWPGLVRRGALLGVPMHGAPLELAAHVAAFVLETIWNPWTKLIGKAMNLRSAGIKDLRHGFVLDDDWRARDPDQLRLAKPRTPNAPPDIEWFVAVASVVDARSRLAPLLGDGAVPRSSAQGRGFGTPAPGLLPSAATHHFERTSHAALLGDPEVLAQLLEWWPSEDG